MTTFNQAQYDDLAVKSKDVYAQTKYDIWGATSPIARPCGS
jgi:hypothetical protein